MDYFDFDLLIERSGDHYRARVLSSPAGQAMMDFNVPYTEIELENFLLRIGRPRRSTRSARVAELSATKSFGERLFRTVFADDINSCFHRSLDEAKRHSVGLRLRLRLSEAPELANVPWEYLYCNSSIDRFFCLSSETPIVRYVELPELIRPLSVAPPIRILVMVSNPHDQASLDVQQEWERLNGALQPLKQRGLIKLDRLEKATLPSLQKQLRQHRYHILHFIGHGDFDQTENDGVLILEDENHQSQRVSGGYLGMLLYDERTLRLVVLNACEGARGSVTDPYAGTAQSLVRRGIPAVIAMQFEVTDQTAITLAQEFYDALADGYPVDAALAEARKAIFAQGNNVEWGTPVLYMRSPDGRIFDLAQSIHDDKTPLSASNETKSQEQQRARIFLSYKREVIPDEPLALQLYKELSQKYEVFIDQEMPVGTPWAERIEAELRRCDFLIVLLSGRSVNSEMVKAEIETALRLAREQHGRPTILPVRLNYREQFPYPISAYLNHINWAFWQSEVDTATLVSELHQAIQSGALKGIQVAPERPLDIIQKAFPEYEPAPAAQPFPLEMPEGTMDAESNFYIEREGDRVALDAICRQGVTITIKAPRQMGKSSLLIRIMQTAQKLGKRTVFLDFQLFDKTTLSLADAFFRQFCTLLTQELGMSDQTNEYWQSPLGNSQRSTRYFEHYLLKELGDSSLVLAMDEVESIFDTDFRSDFFSMLRNWHNNRAIRSIWKKLDLALVTSTEPYQLVANLNQSPFNVGEVIDLPDFTLEQVADLNQRHGTPLSVEQLAQLMALVSGHPYLIRRALYLVASQRLSANELFARARDDRGPFGDHLRYHLFRLYGKNELIQAMRQVIHRNKCPDERIFFRLRGAGLVRREQSGETPRCQLYADYFSEHLPT